MNTHKFFILTGIFLVSLSLILAIVLRGARAEGQSLAASFQAGEQPQCRQDSCVGACRMETMVWGSIGAFDGYFNEMIPHAGCDASELEELFNVTFDLIAEVAAVETGAFLNCGQIEASVDYACNTGCQTNACLYSPNLRATIANTDPKTDGVVIVELDNRNGSDDGDDPRAITGPIEVFARLQLQGWNEAIPFVKIERNSLGYPRFREWAPAVATICLEGNSYCGSVQALANAALNTSISIPLPAYGGIYALESLITAQHHIDIPSGDGYVSLIEDGDSVTLQSGLSGILFIREDKGWDGVWEEQRVEAWDSFDGEYSISNEECKSFCWSVFGRKKINRDIFVMVLDGPCEKMILGDYTLQIDAPLDHDKNITNNTDTTSYSIGSLPAGCAVQPDTAITESTLANGVYDLSFANEYIKYYKVVVPENTSLLEVILEGQSDDPNDNLSLLMSHETYPTTTRNVFLSYEYSANDDPGYPDKLRIPVPDAGEWIIEVYHSGSVTYTGDFTLTINMETASQRIIPITEGQYDLQFPAGQTSQVFRLDYPNRLVSMQVNLDPPSLGPFTNYKIYMCPQFTPKISYEHTNFPGTVCDRRVMFDRQGIFSASLNAVISNQGGLPYYILVERENGTNSENYKLNVDYTWPAGIGGESEPNDDCANADAWPAEEMGIPRRGHFDNPGANGDIDSYQVMFEGDGGSVEMETYLASVPGNILPDLAVFKKVGQVYQEVSADRSAPLGGSPKLRFPFFYGTQYCIQVSSRDLTENSGDPYSLYFRFAGLADGEQTEVEPNNFSYEANLWEDGSVPIRGKIDPFSDKDFYKWKATVTGVYFVSIANTPTIPLHDLLVYEENGLADDNSPILTMINQGSNLIELAPVGLYFFARQDQWYYFEVMPQESPSGWYKLTLHFEGDLGPTCYGAPMLRLGQARPSSPGLTNSLTSQLGVGDTDCFRLMTSTGGSMTLSLTQSPAGVTPLVEIFHYNPNAFDFEHLFDTPVLLAESTFASGSGPNGEYSVGFTTDPSVQGLKYTFPAYVENSGYCACISDRPPSGGTTTDQDGNGSTGGSRSGDQMESEPNETTGQASNWDPTSPIQGSLNTEGDVDYYQFTATQSAIYKITLSNIPANIAPRLSMYRSNDSMVYMKAAPRYGDSIVLEIDADQGETFYIKINAQSRMTISDQYYVLSAEIIPDPLEPNNTLETASAWDAFNASIQGYFHDRLSGPSDYYVFTVPQSAGSALLNVNLSDVPANVPAKLYLKLADGTQVTSNFSSTAGQPISIMIDANPGETYYVQVTQNSPEQVSSSPYTLSVTTIPDPYEPNDTIETASLWDYTAGPIQGYFHDRLSGPSDYYVFTVPQSAGSALLNVNLSDVPANVSAKLYLKLADGTQVTSNFSSTAGQPISIMIDANPGETYYVQVTQNSPQQVSSSPYTLSVTTIPDPYEPNDTIETASLWDYTAGPIQGYFADRRTGPGDYYEFTAPVSQAPASGPVSMTIQLENVPANVTPRLYIYDGSNRLIKTKTGTNFGESLSLAFDATPGAVYYVRVISESQNTVSPFPYRLVMVGYEP
jgi:hypothetical protein